MQQITILKSILEGAGAIEIRGSIDIPVRGITYDSRNIEKDYIFAALPGIHTDGHDYIDRAISRGAKTIIHEKELKNYQTSITYVRVKESRPVLSRLSDAYYRRPSSLLGVIGVTGTDGKSTTVWFIHQLLKALGKKSGFLSTVNVQTDERMEKNPLRQSTPEAPEVHLVLNRIRESGCEFAVIEATSHGLSKRTARLSDVRFDAAVMTNVTHEHLEFHGSFGQYISDKANLFRSLDHSDRKILRDGYNLPKIGIVNLDDPQSDYFRQSTKQPVYSYSISRSNADLSASSIKPDTEGTGFIISQGTFHQEVRLNIPGIFNVENVLAASLTVSRFLNIGIDTLMPFVPGLIGVTGRMIRIQKGQDFSVIVDYAHTPGAFKKLFPMINSLTKGRLISVFGSAGERDREKRPLQGKIASEYCDIIILADEDPRLENPNTILEEIALGCTGCVKGESLFLIPDREEAISFAFSLAKADDTILLLGKGHESSIIYPDGPHPWNEIEIAERLLQQRVNK